MSTTYKKLGQQVGALVDEKNAAYGASFAKSGPFLQLLYPAGLKPEAYTNALLLARIFDKQMRIATDNDATGESPFQDIAGYGLLGAQMHDDRKAATNPEETNKQCGSVSAKDAVEGSTAQNGSAAQPAPRPTTTSAEPQIELPLKPESPAPSSATSNVSVVRAAAKSNRVSVVDRALARNNNCRCAMCDKDVLTWHPIRVASAEGILHVCSKVCCDELVQALRKETR